MATSVNIIDTKFYNEFKNDIGFGSNPADFTTNLAGSVMENLKLIYQIDVSTRWVSVASQGDGLASVGEISPGVLELRRNVGKKWRDDNFSIGDTVLLTWTDATSSQFGRNQTGTVASITDEIMILNWGGYPTGGINGWINNSTTVYNTSPNTALKWYFGLNENSANAVDIKSQVSDNDQGYYGFDIGFDTGGGVRDTNFQNLIRLGNPVDWQTGSMRARFVSNPNILHGQPITERFEIEHEFMIVPWYLDGELSDLQNGIIPQRLLGTNSFKYAWKAQWLRVLNNINTAKDYEYKDTLGDVGHIGESFNGHQNFYQVNSISYQEQATANPADGLLIASKTRVIMQVESLQRPFVVGERIGVYVSYLPDEDEYKNPSNSFQPANTTDLKENFLYDRALGNSGGSGFNGDDFITNLTVFSPTGGGNEFITLQFDVEYSSAQKARLATLNSQDPRYFFIGVELGDVTIPSGNSDRLILPADVELYDESPDIPGLMEVTKFDIYQHNQQHGVGVGTTDSINWNEDGEMIDFEFKLNLAQDAVINLLQFKVVAYNDVTGEWFDLDSFDFNNIGTATVSNGVQQLSENTTRGYNLANNDQFNFVKLNTGSLVVQEQFYDGMIGQKMPWQDWIQNLNVDNLFFDNTKPNNNKNLRASNYSGLNDYTIRYALFANLDGKSTLGVSGNTNYLFLSPPITVNDYDKDGNVTPDWVGTIETFHPTTAVNLQGAVLSGTDTIMRTTWVPTGAPVVSVAFMWAIHRVEPANQPGFDIDELSTINPFPTPNKPIPLVSETQLKIDPISGNVVTECRIDGSQINSATQYNLSARLHEYPEPIPDDGKLTEQSVLKGTEAAVAKIVE